MASKRCFPTHFFKDPDILMVGKDTQLILDALPVPPEAQEVWA